MKQLEEINEEIANIKELCQNMRNELNPVKEAFKDYDEDLKKKRNEGITEAIDFLRSKIQESKGAFYSLNGLIKSIDSATDRMDRNLRGLKK